MKLRDVGQSAGQGRALLGHSLGICLVDRGITACGGSPVQLARSFSPHRGKETAVITARPLGSKVEMTQE